jgi:hypothetical protein
VGFDRIKIDPGTTERRAREHVDSSEVDALVAELKAIELSEDTYIRWATLKSRLALAVRRYEYAVAQYCKHNPIYFEPREGEEIVCPLIEHAQTI